MTSTTIHFPPFQLDLRAGQLSREGQPIQLRPKTFAVLQYLAERPGELLTKHALLDAVWTGVAVSEDVVRISANELRNALGDDRTAPRFIETVPRRGYRFVARMGAEASPATDAPLSIEAIAADPAFDDPLPPVDAWIVGREEERAAIGAWLQAARSGQRQIGFVTGEAGIGKTTLVETALRDLERTSRTKLRVARGQCVERHGGGAPYLPVLEAIASLRCADGPATDATLRRHAPGWLLRATETSSPTEASAGAAADTHEHTLQMLAASLVALADQAPLVLVLEDVHWSDYSTLDLLSLLAQRREPARLLVLCTMRPVDAIVHNHPVAKVERELVRKELCHEIQLAGLPEADLERYLAARFPGAELPGGLLPLLFERSDGNPFLAVVLVDHLLASGMLVEKEDGWELQGGDALRTSIPEGLVAVLEPRLERLTADERRVLEGASVAGPEFAAHVVAAVAPAGSDVGDIEVVEQLCDRLARRQDILRGAGEVTWPDGTTSARYAFRHALYQQVIAGRLTPSRRRRLHQSIGERLEGGYAGRTAEVASELAAHFDRSKDVERAIRYHEEAAAHAGSRLAYQEIRLHLKAALDHLRSQPESPEELRRELPLLHQLGWILVAIHSWGAQEAFDTFLRMRELAERLEDAAMRLRAMECLRSMHVMRAEYARTRAVCEETMTLAKQLGDDMATGAAHVDLAAALIHLGELESAHDHAERARALVDEASIQAISARVLLAGTCAHLGWVARSNDMRDEALARATLGGIPYFAAFAAMHACWSTMALRDVERTSRLARETLDLATERGFAIARIYASMFLGWCDVEEGRTEEGRAALRAAFAEFGTSGERTSTTNWHAILAGAHVACGDVASANEVLDAAFAFVAETGERFAEQELHRLRGECLLVGAPTRGQKERAAEQFERAIAIAAERKASLFELRAATSLLRLRGKMGRGRVERLVARFVAENDCADARIARALLRG
jgi:DNA-binding winged helix-turn-helix (wHTH) protein/tetratricopeptide (TPR) repeat protein/type II secretory pathway predicted ATPase ExeA